MILTVKMLDMNEPTSFRFETILYRLEVDLQALKCLL